MLKSTGIGVFCAVVCAVLAFVIGSKTDVVTAYLAPGLAIVSVLSPVVPSAFVYWVDPDGGPWAFLVQALAWSLLSWSILFGVVYHHRQRFFRIRRR
jgi:hypothetical protein